MTQLAAAKSGPGLDRLALSETDLNLLLQLVEETPDAPTSPNSPFPKTADRLAEKMAAEKLSEPGPELAAWIDAYNRVGRRASYLWNWCRRAVEITMLPCVEAEAREELCDTKTLGVMLDVLLDDVADGGGDIQMLECLLSIIETGEPGNLGAFSRQEREYIELAGRLWREIISRTRRLPKHKEYADLLAYDYRQLANVMRYSHLINRCPEMMNEAEHDLYTPHNMHIMICSTIDLMASPAFDRRELGRVRELMWHAQCMGRIGNLVTTWQREVKERDFTSGIFARALSTEAISTEQLSQAGADELMQILQDGGLEQYYLDRWRVHRRFLLERGKGLRSFEIRPLVEGFEALICLHLGSRGKK